MSEKFEELARAVACMRPAAFGFAAMSHRGAGEIYVGNFLLTAPHGDDELFQAFELDGWDSEANRYLRFEASDPFDLFRNVAKTIFEDRLDSSPDLIAPRETLAELYRVDKGVGITGPFERVEVDGDLSFEIKATTDGDGRERGFATVRVTPKRYPAPPEPMFFERLGKRFDVWLSLITGGRYA